MAGPASRSSAQKAPSSRSGLLRCIAITILVLVVLTGLAVLIIWLVVNPRRFQYTIEDGLVHGFDLNHNHLNASFDFAIRAYNPNSKVSLYYDSIEVYVAYDDQTLAMDVVKPFFQPHRNATRLEVKPVARSVPLLDSVSEDLRLEKTSGDVELVVRVKARIRFKVGAWKSTKCTMKATCSPVVLHLSSSKVFDRTYCDEDF
ncbi:PREDICTED: uncharacterized protein At1g08160-like [Nelumbo nucifera]|uniref:Late embryogenesis abundant protein LEA-2 subgroup domain-containing protein n=2 Tax=Nelumbo nucifera TaxID=4432 RepID=A0A822ZV59_NELNU|nr:PREDICTED: uncharacterized protein At1g08160-like [Nelumbo nucifera]DAD48767.1 TPA_asm: hypothetical protein HUJ06_018704 [Nelumbo nucifera]